MRAVVLAVVLGAVCLAAAPPGGAASCQSEIARIEQQLGRVSDAAKRKIVQAILDQARRAQAAGDANRCLADVAKAQRMLGR